MNPSAGIDVARAALPPLPDLASRWRNLESRSSHSFFMSWSWIGRWIESLPADVPCTLLTASDAGRLVGLAVVSASAGRRHGILGYRALHVASTGRADLDELTIEYNGFLAETGLEDAVWSAFLSRLLESQDWDELYLDGWGQTDRIESISCIGGIRARIRWSSCRHVDLGQLRASGRRYVDGLSNNTRYRLRRSARELQPHGPLTLEVAGSAGEALEMLSELADLHQATWHSRGKPGSFSNPHFHAFHRDLVERGFAEGVIQLMRLRAGRLTVGCLYNFLHHGRVYQYQSGFNYAMADRISPGLLCHAHAIEFNQASGHEIYDFMAGEQRYKTQLAPDAGQIAWIVLQRPRTKFKVEDWLRRARQACLAPFRS